MSFVGLCKDLGLHFQWMGNHWRGWGGEMTGSDPIKKPEATAIHSLAHSLIHLFKPLR